MDATPTPETAPETETSNSGDAATAKLEEAFNPV